MPHDAFISYNHADSVVAREFERGLERLAKPLLKLRALDVFRDETGMGASPGLWASIVEHLNRSEWFLLMCSPQAAASPWCGKEIEWWLANRSTNRILLLLTEGELVWNSQARNFDGSRTNALPPLLHQKFPEEPLFTDLRWARGQSGLGLTHPRFRDAVLNVAATLRGIPKDELDGADVRQLRRNRLFVRSLFATIAVAAVAALWQWYEATQERDAAREQARIATSRKLVADSVLPGTSLDSALLISAEAYQVAPTRDAHENLIRLLHENDRAEQFLFGHASTIDALGFSPDGSRLASADQDGQIILWDKAGEGLKVVFRRSRLFAPKGARFPTALLFNKSADRLFATYLGGESMVFTLAGADARGTALAECLGGKQARVAISLDGSKAAVRTQDGALTLRELRPDACASASQLSKRGSRAFAVSPNGTRLAALDEESGLIWWDIGGRSGRASPESEIQYAPAARLLLGPQDKTIAAASDHTLELWDVSSGTKGKLVFRHQYEGHITALTLGPNGDQLAIGLADGSAELWRWPGGKVSREQLRGHRYGFHVTAAAFNHDGSLLATAGEDGLVMLWYLGLFGHDKPLGRELRGAGTAVAAIAFDNHARLAAASGDAILLWNTAVSQDRPFLPHLQRMENIYSSYFDPSTGTRLNVTGFTLTEADKDACGLVATAQFIAGRELTPKQKQGLVDTLEYTPTCEKRSR
jgi:WD40 repeat protein